MSQALAYEAGGTPSLTGFLVWLSGDDVEVRRQPGPAGEDGEGLIRVMTVHGAKGLESPIVILPDCARRRPPQEGRVLAGPDGLALWRGRQGERPDPVEALAAAETERQLQERKRLLYVALTRAESWLIVAAAGETRPAKDDAEADGWHAMVEDGLARCEGIPGLALAQLESPWGEPIRRLSWGEWPSLAPAPAPAAAAAPAPVPALLPDWVAAPLPPAPPRAQARAATALGGAKVVAGAPEDPGAPGGVLFGTRLHLLLEHLPGRDPAEWPELARDLLAGAEGGLPDPAGLALLLEEAREVLTAPALTEVFDLPPGAEVLSEVALAAPLPGLGPVWGRVDRLVITDDRVLAIDYKSNREVPACPEEVPAGILRQLAAYLAALAAIWPGRQVEAAVLWTATRSLMALPPALLEAALADLDPATPGA